MAIDFSNKILVTNPTTYYIGLSVAFAGIVAIIFGIITSFTGDILLPASGWCALGVPTAGTGGVLMPFGLTRQ